MWLFVETLQCEVGAPQVDSPMLKYMPKKDKSFLTLLTREEPKPYLLGF